MTSNLGCVGLAVRDEDDLNQLVDAVLPATTSLGRLGDLEVVRWQDPSGTRLILTLEDGEWVELLPSFAGSPGALLSNLFQVNEDVATANVVDPNGEQLTGLGLELEQRRLLSPEQMPLSGAATLTALGIEVSVYPNATEFFRSDDSLFHTDGSDPGERPAHFQPDWVWPPRIAAESWMSTAVFAAPEDADAHARLAGTVLRAERRTVSLTGQDFIAARVRTVGFEVDVCLSAADHPTVPLPGQVITGWIFLTASLVDLPVARPPQYRSQPGWRRD